MGSGMRRAKASCGRLRADGSGETAVIGVLRETACCGNEPGLGELHESR